MARFPACAVALSGANQLHGISFSMRDSRPLAENVSVTVTYAIE